MARGSHVAWLKTHVATRAQARRMAKEVLEARLAACANLTAIESFYWWEGRIEQAGEIAVVFKTDAKRLAKLRGWVRAHHPYKLPYVAWGTGENVPASYARWVSAAAAARRTRPRPSSRGRGTARTR